MKLKAKIMDEQAVKRALARISYEIVEHCKSAEDLLLVGIKTRGAPLARAIGRNIAEIAGAAPPTLELDIKGFRDDAEFCNGADCGLEKGAAFGKDIVLVDDVLFTGRAAIEAVLFSGRARSIRLAVLVDRGHRELPIKADFVGKNVPTSRREEIVVRISSADGETGVYIYERD